MMRGNKGQSYLPILLGVAVFIFVIGFLIMIFSLMGGELEDATLSAVSGSANNETLTTVTETGENLEPASDYKNGVCTVSLVTNGSGIVINSGNYTNNNCILAFTTGDTTYNNTDWNVTYSYTAEANTTASTVIFESSDEISGVTDWFGIIIIITAMVVLIGLTVIIIVAIKGTGVIGTRGGKSVSTA